MLPPYIIEQIRRREDNERRRYEQPVVELPLPRAPLPKHERLEEDKPQRGVVIIDL